MRNENKTTNEAICSPVKVNLEYIVQPREEIMWHFTMIFAQDLFGIHLNLYIMLPRGDGFANRINMNVYRKKYVKSKRNAL